ncbi:MAG TPA: pyridoxal-phosphate dependent enzyme [Longimicrobiales bacterium]|nr:pyridoxal-phosphate dependent enzyme [Longimicrobiales bacterium]
MDDRSGSGQDEAVLPLLERFPRLAATVPRMPLARLPTPVERLPIEGTDAFIKRDDLTGGLYGGNKVRKLEFLLPAARAAAAERIITVGAIGSHHALATTLYGVREGFRVTVVLMPQTPTEHVRRVLAAMTAYGAEVRLVGSAAAVPAGVIAARLAHRRERVHVVPAGGSNAVGTLGYVNAALELAAQCDEGLCPVPAEVHVAAGTLGTAVGLALGFSIAGLPTRVIAQRITSRAITNRRRVRRLVRGAHALIASAAGGARHLPDPDAALQTLRIDHHQIGRGYGFETGAGGAALDWFDTRVGLELDATYTAKAAAGFLAAIEAKAAGPLLYWHSLSSVEPQLPSPPLSD